MNADRRSHVRVKLAVKSAFFSPEGFMFNISVLDISSSGIRLEIPVNDPQQFGREGVLKLFFQPVSSAEPVTSYILEIPCRMVWSNDKGAGIEFLDPDPDTRDTLDGLISRPNSPSSTVSLCVGAPRLRGSRREQQGAPHG